MTSLDVQRMVSRVGRGSLVAVVLIAWMAVPALAAQDQGSNSGEQRSQPAGCDDSRWADCVGWPADDVIYDDHDPATGADPKWAGLSQRERVQRWKELADGEGDDAVRALIDLGWYETQRQRRDAADRYYQRALSRSIQDPSLRRRLHWSLALSCAELGEFPCAREHWFKAGALAEGHPRWLPAAYAYGLWELGEPAQAVAWYAKAVHGNAALGRGTHAGMLAAGTPLNEVSRAVFAAWSSEYAPMLATVVAQLDIGPDGRVERVLLQDNQLDPQLALRVQAAIAGWRFEPPRHEGRPVVLRTYASVDVRGRIDETGTARFEIQYVHSGLRASPTSFRSLRYPQRSLRKLQQGRVLVRVQVNPDGTVDRAEVVESSGHRELDQETLRQVSGWTFLTESVDGVGLPGETDLPIEYQLTEGGSVGWTDYVPLARAQRAGVIRGLSRRL